MVNNGFELGFKIEDILVELMQDANATKLKGLKDACLSASGKNLSYYSLFDVQLDVLCCLYFQGDIYFKVAYSVEIVLCNLYYNIRKSSVRPDKLVNISPR